MTVAIAEAVVIVAGSSLGSVLTAYVAVLAVVVTPVLAEGAGVIVEDAGFEGVAVADVAGIVAVADVAVIVATAGAAAVAAAIAEAVVIVAGDSLGPVAFAAVIVD